jgi:RHS repeat-associated protein
MVSESNEFRFPGQRQDRETDLYYNWHRYYDPRTGRYLQPDPIGLAGGMNPFSYGRNNPLTYLDLFGLQIYTAEETNQILQEARQESWWELPYNHIGLFARLGKYDFGYTQPNAKFTVDGMTLSAGQFGNYLAGYVGQYKSPNFLYGVVRVAGVFFDVLHGNLDFDSESIYYIDHGALRVEMEKLGRRNQCNRK